MVLNKNDLTNETILLFYWILNNFPFGICLDAHIVGITFKTDSVIWDKDQYVSLNCANLIPVDLFGINLNMISSISFAHISDEKEEFCDDFRKSDVFDLNNGSSYKATSKLDLRSHEGSVFIMCAKISKDTQLNWVYQKNIKFKCDNGGMPLWVLIILIIILFILSGLFSGLNLGLMALTVQELKILERSGNREEVSYAKTISPVRARGNLLLCSLLIGNVIVNTTQAIFIGTLTGSGLLAVILTSIGIVILGEIIPQAACSKHALMVGAKTIWITKFVILITFVVAFPISLLLDAVLGKEGGTVYTRNKVAELIRQQGNLGAMKADEVNIITGALNITTKTVRDIMIPLSDIFMIPHKSRLGFNTVNDIVKSGYSRIPVYSNERSNICALLHVKDLTFVDPDDLTPLQTVIDFYNRPVHIVKDTTKLNEMLHDFSKGTTHLAIVEDTNSKKVGLVTLEDVIEEIIQTQIVDETDVITDKISKNRRRKVSIDDFSIFRDEGNVRLSPQMKVVALRHMTSNIASFSERLVMSSIMKLLLNSNIVVNVQITECSNNWDKILYDFKRETRFVILLLEGHALVEVGSEKLVFDAGPFVLFGEPIFHAINSKLKQITNWKDIDVTMITKDISISPDYRVTAQTNLQYLQFTPELYVKARVLSKSGSLFRREANVSSLIRKPSKNKTGIISLDDVIC